MTEKDNETKEIRKREEEKSTKKTTRIETTKIVEARVVPKSPNRPQKSILTTRATSPN